ncbi:hypothetical protein LEP1GSC032_0179 [Leptospira interrogans str. 2002000631]|nr:hypothetical protein LEP1GSC007_2704 [Leptospira interrogans serovar Bulgarica str. Mallika]EJP16641.1 hypothetical protein LEP1GSC080_0439 [Leptospira interrogans str. FPW2026]EMJ80315.1 hypothetical protein LEP1GSC032_0179 [Leptospira interrogans str. 2002000631]EMM90806.1 hypothetical protein LEP1GSC145_0611 [Leptospira interrogans serovar Djasiman str. LT1649]EMN78826.1 hypothetical protein LEP1GSC106_1996 [Leptospira interrogans serovar Grippotyphosa str. UI 12764]
MFPLNDLKLRFVEISIVKFGGMNDFYGSRFRFFGVTEYHKF